MAGQWRPKYKAKCPKCGWSGKRTKFTIAIRPCPQCKESLTKRVGIGGEK